MQFNPLIKYKINSIISHTKGTQWLIGQSMTQLIEKIYSFMARNRGLQCNFILHTKVYIVERKDSMCFQDQR